MQLTTKQIKQIIKRELRSILSESDFQRALSKWNKVSENEPQAWESQKKQYIELIRSGEHEFAVMGMTDNPEILASILKESHSFKIRPFVFKSFLDKTIEISESSGGGVLSSIIYSYIDKVKDDLAKAFSLNSPRDFEAAIRLLSADHALKWSFGISTSSDGYMRGSGRNLQYKVYFQDIYLINEFISFIKYEAMAGDFVEVYQNRFTNQVTIGLKQ